MPDFPSSVVDAPLLVTRYLEGDLSAAELADFDEQIQNDPDLARMVRDVSMLGLCLQESGCGWSLDDGQLDEPTDAPAPSRGMLARALGKFSPRVSGPLPLSLLVAALAVGMLLAVMASWFPPGFRAKQHLTHHESAVVARLTGIRQVEWAPAQLPLNEGATLVVGQRVRLVAGFSEITFDNGATAILQGPAQLQISSASEVLLEGGRIAAVVPPTAHGFAVATTAIHVKDLGTEFGVVVDETGTVDVAVFTGQVEVSRPQATNPPSESRILRAGQSIQVTADGAISHGTLESRPLNLVRTLPPKTEFLDIADMIAGGDGTQLTSHAGLDLTSGTPVDAFRQGYVPGDGTYRTVDQASLVDGLFLLPGQPGEQQLSSTGQAFDGFPANTGSSWGNLWAWGPQADARLGQGWPAELVARRGRMIALHPNAGVTIDLRAVRQAHPQRELTSFFALFTNEYIPARSGRGNLVDVWILVDGQLIYNQRGVPSGSAPLPIHLPLTANDDFLTIATTDGGDGLSCDFAVFRNAKLRTTPHLSQTTSE